MLEKRNDVKRAMTDFEKMRSNMVQGQLLPNEISNNRLLRAFTELPRELFVAREDQALAYSDHNLKIGLDRFLLKPFVISKLLQAAELQPYYKVLDIGASTGYGPALLSYSVRLIVAVEEEKDLVEQLVKNMEIVDAYSVIPVHRSLRVGAEEDGPYDVILIEGAVEEIPSSLFDQLKEGGKLLTLESKDVSGLAQAVKYQKIANSIIKRPLFECEAYLLPPFKKNKPEFQF